MPRRFQIVEWISAQSALPWDNVTFLGEGHTINFEPFNSTKFNFEILTSRLDILPKAEIENYRNSKINLFWMVPTSKKERQNIIDNRSDIVIDELNKIGANKFSLVRDEPIKTSHNSLNIRSAGTTQHECGVDRAGRSAATYAY